MPSAELVVLGEGGPDAGGPNAPAQDATGGDRTLGVLLHLGADDRSSPRVRLVDAALRCLARQGTTKTTVDDIAREAGLSRATLYRTFPGGKESVLAAVVDTEVARLFSALAVSMGGANDLEDVLVVGMTEAARRLSGHRTLGYLMSREPEVMLPHLAFAQMDRVLLAASDFAAPFFARWLEPHQARRAAEWAVRIVFSYLATPTPEVDLTNPDHTRTLVQSFVLPGVLALRGSAPGPEPTRRPASVRNDRKASVTRAKGTTT
jgi:AcrR family transcriptional regulator